MSLHEWAIPQPERPENPYISSYFIDNSELICMKNACSVGSTSRSFSSNIEFILGMTISYSLEAYGYLQQHQQNSIDGIIPFERCKMIIDP